MVLIVVLRVGDVVVDDLFFVERFVLVLIDVGDG